MKNYSVESLFNNKVFIKQSKNGYRYSVDPVLLSYFAKPLSGNKVVDLGTGCGIIPIILSHRIPNLQITGVEIQQNLFSIAKENIEKNNLESNVKIISSDMKSWLEFFEPDSMDMVIANPPYTKKNSGRINPDKERAIARHEIKITLKELIGVASGMLKDRGEFVVVYPEKRLSELLSVMKSHRLFPDRLRFVYPRKNERARLVLLRGIKNGKDRCFTEEPLFIYDDSESYSDEMKRMFE